MAARDLYEKQITFTPTHKAFLQTNHRPRIRGTDHGMWRRIHFIPYLVTIKDEEKQENFREKMLIPELPGILNWLLAGLRQYLEIGLKPPPSVCDATEKYKREMDTVGQWIDLAIRADATPGVKVSLTDLHRHYSLWFADEISRDWKPASNKKLADRLREHGYKDDKEKGYTYFFGIKLDFTNAFGIGTTDELKSSQGKPRREG